MYVEHLLPFVEPTENVIQVFLAHDMGKHYNLFT